MSVSPSVSVVIPHYHDLAALDLCLALLAAQTYPRERYDIIVADNASPEGEAAVAAIIAGRAKLVVVPQKGAGPARNGAVAASRGEILAFIDSDCQAEPDWLTQGVAALSDYDFVGGQVRVLVRDPLNITPTEAFERVFAFDFEDYITRKGFAGSGNLFCPRALFDRVGGFRVGVSEDVDWSHRATAAGYRLGYAPKAVVGHPARRTWDELTAKFGRVNAETFELMRDRRGAAARWLLRCLALPVSAVVHTPRVITTPRLSGTSQRMAALTVLFRVRAWRAMDGWRLLTTVRRG